MKRFSGGPTTNAKRTLVDSKGRNLNKRVTRPTYKGPTTSKARQKKALTRNH